MASNEDNDTFKKPMSSYCLLQKKMSEIEKSKKLTVAKISTSSKSSPSSSSSSLFSNKVQKDSPAREKECSDKKDQNKNPNIPDRTYGDYFCFICDSHMNSDAMWEAHIIGKRHLKNVKKGDPDSKYEDLDVESDIKYELRNVKDPIVGLKYIHEIRRKEAGAPPLFNCFLCQATFATIPMVIEHLINMKHRLNYIKESSPDDYHLLEATSLKKGQMEPLVAEMALKLEEKFGRGSVKVKQEKIKQISYHKYEDLDVEPDIKYELRNVKGPIIGLSYIHEIRRKEAGAPPLFTCNLCQATFSMVNEHVINMKHRLNFIKEKSPEDYHLLDPTSLRKGQMETLVEEIALKLEEKFGRGYVKVKQEKNRQTSYYPAVKRAFDSDDEDEPRKSNHQKYEENSPYVWKAVDCQKRGNFKEMKDCREIINRKRGYVYSSDEETDTHKKEQHMKRPVHDSHSSSYKSSTASREPSKKEHVYSRITYGPLEEHHSRFRSPSRRSPKKDTYRSRSPPYVPPDSHSRSYQTQVKDPRTSKEFQVPVESKTQQPDSDTERLRDLLQKMCALPTEIFFRVVLHKLEKVEIKGLTELNLLSEIADKALTISYNKIPPMVKQRLSQNSDNSGQNNSTLPVVTPSAVSSTNSFSIAVKTQTAPSNTYSTETSYQAPGSHLPGSDFNYIKHFLNQSKGNNDLSSPYQNVIPHHTSYQNVVSPPNSLIGNNNSFSYNSNIPSSNDNYLYNGVPSSTASSIPGLTLTEESRNAQLYNTYQPHYSDPSSSYPSYRY